MQPASAGGANGGGNRALRRWGPIAGIVAVIAVVVGVVVVSGGDDDDDGDVAAESTVATVADTAAPPTSGAVTTAPTTPPSGTDGTAAPGSIPYPLTFSQAVTEGIDAEVDWGERCDTARGRLAFPDYFAPECYAPFDGDNGGATSRGITDDTIKLVWYLAPEQDPIINYITDAIAGDDTNDQRIETMENVVRFYHTYYELYGRRIELIPFQGSGFAADEVAARADAVRIAEEIQPFAVLSGPVLTTAFSDELAARQVMCIVCGPTQPTSYYAEREPYAWAIDDNAEQKQDHVVEFVQKQLAGKNAEFAGAALAGSPRTFGLVYLTSGPSSAELADRFAGLMEAAGAPLVETIPYALDPVTIQQTALQTITRLKTAGVTTVLFLGDPVAPRDFTREATAQDYFPEWVLARATLTDTRAFGRTYDQEQWQHAFGVTSLSAPARTDGRRLPGAVRVVQRHHGAGRRVRRHRPGEPRAVRRSRPERRAEPDARDVA